MGATGCRGPWAVPGTESKERRVVRTNGPGRLRQYGRVRSEGP